MCPASLILLVRNNFSSIMFISIALENFFFFPANAWFPATVKPSTWPNGNAVPWSNWCCWMIQHCRWVKLLCSLSQCGTPVREMCFLFSYQNKTRSHLISDPRCYLPPKSNLSIYFWLKHPIKPSTPHCTLWQIRWKIQCPVGENKTTKSALTNPAREIHLIVLK